MNLGFDCSSPLPLNPDHVTLGFSCGEVSLDHWLQKRALSNQFGGASRTYVSVDQAQKVIGYYALAAGAVSHQIATSRIKRNMPDPVPVLILGRLAVDIRAQGMKLGAALLQDAVRRTMQVSQEIGVRALLVHALNDSAKQFYSRFGFMPSPVHPMTMLLELDQK